MEHLAATGYSSGFHAKCRSRQEESLNEVHQNLEDQLYDKEK